MKSHIFLATFVSLTSVLATAAPGLTESLNLPVSVRSGYCPKHVKLSASARNYEGGGEWTVIAGTSAIARPARLISRNNKVVVFRAPLKSAFKSCRGVAVSKDVDFNSYKFDFQKGRVTFRVTLPKDTPSNPSAITRARIDKGRPFVKWAIAD